MELDLRYKQYQLDAEDAKEKSNKEGPARPHEDVLKYLEGNIKQFTYQELYNVVKNIQGLEHLTLNNGTQVKLAVREGIINLGFIFPDKSSFVGTWSNITDQEELLKKCQSM